MIDHDREPVPMMVFVAGPLVHGGSAFQWRNVAAAVRTAHTLRKHRDDIVPIVPHLSMFADMIVQKDDERDWAKWAMQIMRWCDVVVLSGYTDAEPVGGTAEEIRVADDLGIPIFDCPAAFFEWLEN